MNKNSIRTNFVLEKTNSAIWRYTFLKNVCTCFRTGRKNPGPIYKFTAWKSQQLALIVVALRGCTWDLASGLRMNIQGHMHMFFKASLCFLLKTVLFARKLGGGKGEILPFFVILRQNQKNFLNRPFFVSVAEAGWKKTLDKGGAGCYSVGKFNHRNRWPGGVLFHNCFHSEPRQVQARRGGETGMDPGGLTEPGAHQRGVRKDGGCPL